MNPNKPKNPIAVALGKLAAGKPKRFSPEEIEKRTARIRLMAQKRWAGHVRKYPQRKKPAQTGDIATGDTQG